MIILVSLSMLAIAFVSYQIAKSWLFPPALYSLYWSAIMIASLFIKFGEYELTIESFLIFYIGCLVFSSGGLISYHCLKQRVIGKQITKQRKHFIQNIILVYSFALLLVIPFFVSTLHNVVETLNIENFAAAVRFAYGESDGLKIPRIFRSLTAVGSVLAYCAAWLYDGTRRDKMTLIMSVFGPLVMCVLTFGRSPVYMLLIGVLAIISFRKTVRWEFVLIGFLLTLLLLISIGSVLGKGPYFERGISPVGAIVENLAIYFVGGPVGFSQVMDVPSSVGEQGLSLRFFTQLAKSFGADIVLPNNVLGYFSDILGNVYTIYFAYWLDAGWWGVIGMSFFAGSFCTGVYMMAQQGNLMAGTALGLVIGSILNSAVGDGIFGSSVPWLLVLLIVGGLSKVQIVSFRVSSVESARRGS